MDKPRTKNLLGNLRRRSSASSSNSLFHHLDDCERLMKNLLEKFKTAPPQNKKVRKYLNKADAWFSLFLSEFKKER